MAKNLNQLRQFSAVVVVFALLQVAFGVDESPTTAPASQVLNLDELREQALRELPFFRDEVNTRFIAIGFDDAKDPADPTREFLDRFADLKPPVRPASNAKRVGRVWNEKKGAPGVWHWEDPQTGKTARIYFAIVRGYRGGNEARIRVGFTSGPLSGGGREAIYRFANDRWELDRVVYDFIS